MDNLTITFETLRIRYQTGRSVWLSGTGRDKKYTYRTGCMTALGDLEVSQWVELAQRLISESGEQALFQSLLQWESEHNYCKMSKKELEFHTLDLHIARIFDREEWVDFVLFNRVYRPDVLKQTELVVVLPECCNTPGVVTKKHTERGDTIPCPHCGRFSGFTICSNIAPESILSDTVFV